MQLVTDELKSYSFRLQKTSGEINYRDCLPSSYMVSALSRFIISA
jgi:hypothetical protein